VLVGGDARQRRVPTAVEIREPDQLPLRGGVDLAGERVGAERLADRTYRSVFSRCILGWRASAGKQTFLVTDALRQALDVRQRRQSCWTTPGLVHHSDAGSQHTSLTFTAELRETGIAGSIGTVGDALDNALCESTIGLFKTEAIDIAGATWTGRREVEWQVASWTAWYNTQRSIPRWGTGPRLSANTFSGRLRPWPHPRGRVTNQPPGDSGCFSQA
jgi:transposase InsO family protein